VEPSAWPVPDRGARTGAPVLGWIGTAGGLCDLEALAPTLAEACARHGARVRVVCDERPSLPGVPVEFVRWRPGGEPQDLSPVDVGLAPLADGPAARCKCGLKAIEYGAVGAPAVASPVGALREIVEPGVTGLHAASPAEWLGALCTLLGDRDARLRMGAAARASVASRWSAAAHARNFDAALRAGSQRSMDSCRHG
jgi:glycosyltransferase involved in cell wall biosynthesis